MSTKKDIVWQIGDTCYLNSGSPKLTVTNIKPLVDGDVMVAWMKYETAELQQAWLPAAALRRTWS